MSDTVEKMAFSVDEAAVRGTKSSSYSQVSTAPRRELDLRKSSWFIKSKHYGKFTVGLDETATYDGREDSRPSLEPGDHLNGQPLVWHELSA